jgi:hypothetical protein
MDIVTGLVAVSAAKDIQLCGVFDALITIGETRISTMRLII